MWTQLQTAGRGRNGSVWIAPAGVLTASFVLDVSISTPQIALAAGLAVCHAVEDRCPTLRVGLKWPNDCVVFNSSGQPGKLAGILCERVTDLSGHDRVVVGIGLNCDPHWNENQESLRLAVERTYPPTSLAEHVSEVPQMIDLLDGLRRYLLEAAGLLRADHWHRIIDSWRERDVLNCKHIQVSNGLTTVDGQATGIDELGRLTVARNEGTIALTGGSITAW